MIRRKLSTGFLLWLFSIICLFPANGDGQTKRNPFPQISGWTQTEELQVFSPDNLYDYIDGAADLYLTYEFLELKVAEYRNESKASVIVEIYRHKTPIDAFGIYSQERLANADFLDIGIQGYYEEKALNFLNGPYYVKISSANTGAMDREIMVQFAKKIAENLGESKGFPGLLTSFPEEGKVKNAEKFIGKNFLGYSFFHSAFTANYSFSGEKFQLFLMEGNGADDCRIRLQKFFQQLKRPHDNLSEGRYLISDPYHGELELFWKGKYIGGILNPPQPQLRSKYLSLLQERLPK